MIPWDQRSREERALLNPGFCACLIWHAALGRESDEVAALAFEEAFLVLPIVLDRRLREALPKSARTSLGAWLTEDALFRGRIATRARLLVGFTKEALLFGGLHGVISFRDGRIHAESSVASAVRRYLKGSSDEVRECAKKAEQVGKWLGRGGASPTVFALIGIRP